VPFNKQHLRNVLLLVLAMAAGFSALLAAHAVTVEGIWFVFSITNIRITTLATAFFVFGLVLFLQGRIRWKPLYYALLAVIFFMGLYEIVWYYVAAYLFSYDLRIFEFAALEGWIVLCIREVYPTKPPKVSLALYALFAASMTLWVATGFEVNNIGQSGFSIFGEALNEVSKTSLALGFAFHIGAKLN
jgi:hypothetical protein